MKSKIFFSVPFLFCILFSSVSQAADPCQTDIDKFCSGVSQDNRMEIGKCLKDHDTELSESCVAFRSQMNARRQAFHQQIQQLDTACQTDAEQLCPDLNGPQKMGCLVQNSSKLSETCKTQVDHMKSAHHPMRTSVHPQ